MSSWGSVATPKRIWWPFRSWSCLRMRQCGAPKILAEARVVIRVVNQVTRKSCGAFGGANATDSKSYGGVLVAKGQEVRRVRAEERDDHITGDAHLMVMWAAKDPGQASDKARVGHGPLNWGREVGGSVPREYRVYDAVGDGIRGA